MIRVSEPPISTTATFNFSEWLMRSRQLGGFAAVRLPASYNQIATSWVDLNQASPPAGAFGGDHRRPEAGNWVEHDVTPF
jgi:hypothetical protein